MNGIVPACENACYERSGKITEKRIIAHVLEQHINYAALGKRTDRTCHVHKSGKEYTEPDGYASEGIGPFKLESHDKDYSDNERQRRES